MLNLVQTNRETKYVIPTGRASNTRNYLSRDYSDGTNYKRDDVIRLWCRNLPRGVCIYWIAECGAEAG